MEAWKNRNIQQSLNLIIPIFRRLLVFFLCFITILFISVLSCSSVSAGRVKSLTDNNKQDTQNHQTQNIYYVTVCDTFCCLLRKFASKADRRGATNTYFINLEKRNHNRKIMNEIEIEKGRTITDEKQISQTKTYYTDLQFKNY